MNIISKSPNYIYLHGFASSPQSNKAQYLRDRFTNLSIPLKIPDLNAGDFSHLTLSRQLQQVEAEFSPDPAPVILIGSSFGGLTSAWLAQRHLQVQKIVLLAPAFQFLSHFLPILGAENIRQWQSQKYINTYHYGEQQELPLHYNFLLDLQKYSDQELTRSLPTLIIHGKEDEVIPIQASRDFARDRPWVNLIEFHSNHTLDNIRAEIWQAIQEFCQID